MPIEITDIQLIQAEGVTSGIPYFTLYVKGVETEWCLVRYKRAVTVPTCVLNNSYTINQPVCIQDTTWQIQRCVEGKWLMAISVHPVYFDAAIKMILEFINKQEMGQQS